VNTLGDWGVITLEDWALIRRLAAEGVPKAQVAGRLGLSRTTVVKAVASDSPPRYERKPAVTSFSRFEPRVRELLGEFPEMPATVLAERVGWDGSRSWFGEIVARLRPQYRRPDPADRLTWPPGGCQLQTPRPRHRQPPQHPHDHRRTRQLESTQPFTFQPLQAFRVRASSTHAGRCGTGTRVIRSR
jgi:hypothetical protein